MCHSCYVNYKFADVARYAWSLSVDRKAERPEGALPLNGAFPCHCEANNRGKSGFINPGNSTV